MDIEEISCLGKRDQSKQFKDALNAVAAENFEDTQR